MRCVSCGGELVGQEACGLQIDRCHLCGGMWLNRGELDSLVSAEDEDVRWLDLDLWAEAQKVTGAVSS
ncbi:MAG: zf-TFIIB domain-containing protein, partial [Anaerolineae bacterium]|nr:zf-TFIIB domain-containing protein [Anaerolineae bacterium]